MMMRRRRRMVILTVMVGVIFSEGRVVCSFPYLHIMVFFISF
jgi:hypothetical protein